MCVCVSVYVCACVRACVHACVDKSGYLHGLWQASCLSSLCLNEVRASQLAQASERGWFSNTSFTTGLIFALKKTRASGRNVGKVFNPVVKLVLENQPLSEFVFAPKETTEYPRPYSCVVSHDCLSLHVLLFHKQLPIWLPCDKLATTTALGHLVMTLVYASCVDCCVMVFQVV